MTTDVRTSPPVLVVGAGPVGLALALDLAQRGVRSVVLERGTAQSALMPAKAGTLNERTMELMRRWGLRDQIVGWGCDDEYPRDTVYLTSLVGGHLVGRSAMPSAAERCESPGSPEILRKCPQFVLDPLLAAAATATGLVDLRHETRLVDVVDLGDHVVAEVVDGDGRHERLRADYLVGCDGAGSTVRRLMHIPFEGRTLDHSVTVVVEIDELERHHSHGKAERFLFLGPDGAWSNATSMDYDRIWRFTLLGFSAAPDLDTIDAAAQVRRALGSDEIPFRILGVVPWRRSQCAARTFDHGRVLLAGDAAHTTSPTGGHGLNTGLGDVSDLGWMLAACLEGWGGPGLLHAYTQERRPVAVRNSTLSSRNYEQWVEPLDYSQILASGAEADAARRTVGDRLVTSLHGEFNSQGVGLGFRYEGSPIVVPDGTPEPPDEVSTFVSTDRPGHRAPHAYLEDGRSTLDLFGEGFVLLRLGPRPPDARALVVAAASGGVPLTVIHIDEPSVARAYSRALVLVRPDGHVAWRGDVAPDLDDAAAIIDTVRGARVDDRRPSTTQPLSRPTKEHA